MCNLKYKKPRYKRLKVYLLALLGYLTFIPLSASAATASLSISTTTQQTIQQEVAAGQAGIQMNIAAAAAERERQAQANAGGAPVTKPSPPVAPPVKVTPPPKPDVTDSTKASEANNVTLEDQNSDASENYPPAPTGFTSSAGNNSNDNTQWDYGF
jgi:hypothetical protein